jgi:hypothetical protein
MQPAPRPSGYRSRSLPKRPLTIWHEWVRRTDEQKNNNCSDPALCRAFESKLKASLNYIL